MGRKAYWWNYQSIEELVASESWTRLPEIVYGSQGIDLRVVRNYLFLSAKWLDEGGNLLSNLNCVATGISCSQLTNR